MFVPPYYCQILDQWLRFLLAKVGILLPLTAVSCLMS
ncbi:Na+-transporting NADH:ubiquinone oxidoreductase subunit NqrE [Pseudomonas baetica]|nr:Na+-transporting NADH:ubiquinone oxidoreductase subunit NqrE [Pseudomonas baetica]